MLFKTFFAFTALFAVAFAAPIALESRESPDLESRELADDLEERSSGFDLEERDPLPPAGWATNYLEPYDQYHERYMQLGCEFEHQNLTFWNACCHPMLKTQTLADRPDYCNPQNNTDDCDDSDDVPAVTVTQTITTTKHTSTAHSTTTTHHTTTTTKKAAAAAATPPPSTSWETGGVATYFLQNGNAGACGNKNPDSAKIAAIDQARYGDSGEKSSLCGKQIFIKNTSNGKTVTVTVADDCPTCKNSNSIDLSVGAFTEIATEAEGEVNIEWYFL